MQDILRAQRDLYAHFHNQVLHLVNQGVTINQIHYVYDLLKSLLERIVEFRYYNWVEGDQRDGVKR